MLFMSIATALVRPDTATGTSVPTLLPLPSWPYWLSPQHTALPFERSAQLDCCEAAICTASSSPETVTGTRLRIPEALSSPSSPATLRPQHFTLPPSSSAQLWSPPAANPATPERPGTVVGLH